MITLAPSEGTPGPVAGLGRDRVALAGLGALIVLLTVCGDAMHRAGAVNLGPARRVEVFVALLAAAATAFLFACGLAMRRVRRAGTERGDLALILLVAAGMRVAPLLSPPFLSSDVYRYVWDGRVQAAGINPYRYIPADPALAPLRDQAIYPHVNRRDYAPTIYPPVAQMVFGAVSSVSQTPLAMKLAAVLAEALATVCLLTMLRRAGRPAMHVLLYTWNPLAAWCFAGNGHVDAVCIGLLGVALLLRLLHHDGWCGVVLGAAVLVKFLPAAVVPAFWRWRWRLPVTLLIMLPLCYLPFLGVGWHHALGFLGAYGGEEGIGDGRGLWLPASLAHLVPIPPGAVRVWLALAALLLVALALVVALRPVPTGTAREMTSLGARVGCLAAASFLVLSPHYPWYFPWFGLFAVLAPAWSLLWLSVAPLLLYLDPWGEFSAWPSLVYVPALALAAIDLRRGMLPFGVVPIPAPAPIRSKAA